MRPRSLIGPRLLIALGALLLMNTLRPQLPVLEILARYWPFLLIGWGALRLLEILVWRWLELPLPSRGLSGGEWTAVVLICLVGSGLYAVNQYRPWERLGVFTTKRVEVFGRTYDFPIAEQRQPAPKAPHVFIENLRGDVRVTGDDVAEVRVSGRKTIRALQDTDAAQAHRQSLLEITVTGNRVVVRTNQDQVTGDHRISADLDLTIPRGASLEARGREGDFEISELAGSVEIASDNAAVRLRNIGGDARVNVRRSDLIRAAGIKGSVELIGGRGRDLEIQDVEGPVTLEGFYSGDLRFANLARPLRFQNSQTSLRVEKVTGRIQMDLGQLSGTQLQGPLRFSSSRARDVELEEFTGSADVSVEGGDITLRPAASPLDVIQVQTRTGDIILVLPESAAFQLRARTDRGSVTNEFSPALKEEPEGRHGATLSGSVGRGPLITLAASRGSITVRKDSGVPLRPRQDKQRSRMEIEADPSGLRIQRH